MTIGRTNTPVGRIGVVVLTADPAFEEQARAGLAAAGQMALKAIPGTLAALADRLDLSGASVVVIDLDAAAAADMRALEGLVAHIGAWPPIVAITQAFDEVVVRALMQMRVVDFLVKPVAPDELARTCARVAKGPATAPANESQVCAFLPAVGGAGVTTIAVQTAIILLN